MLDLFDECIITNLSVCSQFFNLLCLIYLMDGSLEIYLFVHWFLLFCDRNLSVCSLVFTLMRLKPIFLFTGFYSSVIEIYLFVQLLLFLCDRNLSTCSLVLARD